MARRIVLLLLAAAFLATAPGCKAAPGGVASIEGTWGIARAELGGKQLPLAVFENGTLRLTAGKYEFQKDIGDYSVTAGTHPTAIDVMGRQGPNAGKTIPAIFRLQADTLTICYDLSCKARPKDFKTEAGTQLFLVRYIRSAP